MTSPAISTLSVVVRRFAFRIVMPRLYKNMSITITIVSLLGGNTFGRVIAIAAATLGAIGALLSISGANPWWSLAVFFLCIYIIHGIFVFGDDVNAQRPDARMRNARRFTRSR